MTMQIINSSVYGSLPSPDNFAELLELIIENKKTIGSYNVSYWRGQANINWPIDSGAVRRLRQKGKGCSSTEEITEEHICYYEQNLIKHARKNMLDIDSYNRRMTDFELLAKMQHYGAATRLLDFSKSVLVALFFCTSNLQYEKTHGLLFGIDTFVIGGHEDDFDFDFSYKKFIGFAKENNHVLCIAPPSGSNRIAAQHAVLLCSKYAESEHGSLYLNEEKKYYKYIAISPELKKECNNYLRNCFDILHPTMFPDFPGFCEINSAEWAIYAHTRW